MNKTLYGACIMLSLAACKKQVNEVLPGNEQDVAINFHSASDVMETAYGPGRMAIALYVDQFKEQSRPVSSETSNPFPFFSFGYLNGLDYPQPNNAGINYARYAAGDHRLMLTDVNNKIVLDTIIKTSGRSFNAVYVADAMAADGSNVKYKLVVAPDDRKPVDGKTGIRFIHLSADAGTLSCNLVKLNGDLAGTQAGELTFGQYSSYQYFGTDDLATGGLIRFSLSNTANGVKFDTGVPFDAGRNYTIVISGFRTDQQRQVVTGKNADGSVKNETISINNNLHAVIRRSY
ncbi:hypothetical protein [Mucilaginibacter galii]